MRKAIKTLAVTTLALTLALPFTAYAGTWQQDSTGWKVQADDGTYLTNQWYQSPESGLYYYMGADGYMLVNAITPDCYQVGANGVWNPSVTSTQHVTNGQIDTPSTNNNNSNNSDNNSSGYYNEDGYWISTDITDPNDYADQNGGGGTGSSGRTNAY